MQAKDIMTKDVLIARPNTGIAEIAGMMVENRISALPISDPDGQLVGIVSEGDLMRRAEIGTEKQRSWWLRVFAGGAELAEEFTKSHAVKASEVMTTDVVTVDEDTPIAEIADLLESRRIKRVPVMSGDAIVGIVSRANLIQALTSLKEKVVGVTSSGDRLIRDALMNNLKNEPWAAGAQVNVVVTDGVVHLWGLVDMAEQQKALVVAAENVPGVVSVEDHMSRKPAHFGAE